MWASIKSLQILSIILPSSLVRTSPLLYLNWHSSMPIQQQLTSMQHYMCSDISRGQETFALFINGKRVKLQFWDIQIQIGDQIPTTESHIPDTSSWHMVGL